VRTCLTVFASTSRGSDTLIVDESINYAIEWQVGPLVQDSGASCRAAAE
jgi:hypothetical protein